MNLKFCLIGISALFLLQGCKLTDKILKGDQKAAPLETNNTFNQGILPTEYIRIAVLPVYTEPNQSLPAQKFNNIVIEELNKAMRFEVVPVSPDSFYNTYGKRSFSSVGALPLDLLTFLKKTYDTQAILFTDVTHYHPYKPISIGLRCKMVDIETGNIFWAFDHLFDAGDARVALAARQYFQQFNANPYPLDNSESILQSPTRFLHFAVFHAFKTVPTRTPPPPPEPEVSPIEEDKNIPEPALTSQQSANS